MSIYASPSFWSGLGDRAIKTFAQSLLGVMWKGFHEHLRFSLILVRSR
uniref:Holin n=1 Tax=Siphoviridae sp. ctUWs1 TaxID=2826352 RepID=A0A8S5QUH7_9CAUD|nr:MAG TPA: holin [Siphoviridae sp. ctUWs1]